MSISDFSASLLYGFARAMDYLSPLFDLGIRLWIANIFFKAGLSKIQSWDSTLMLFEYEYEVPLLSPKLAAYLGTGADVQVHVWIGESQFLEEYSGELPVVVLPREDDVARKSAIGAFDGDGRHLDDLRPGAGDDGDGQ